MVAAMRAGKAGQTLARLCSLCAALLGGAVPALAAEPGRDPTRPPDALLRPVPAEPVSRQPADAPTNEPIVLQAILRAESRPARVMVDGWLYRIGDLVQGARLTAIGPHSADFEFQGRSMRIPLTPTASISRRPDAGADITPAAAPKSASAVSTKPVRARARKPNQEKP